MISNNPFYLSAHAKFEQQQFASAIEDFNKAIEQEENPSIYSERAVAWFHLGEHLKSIEDMNYAADLEPENPYRYASRAYIKDAMGNTEGAIADYEMAIKLDPEDAIAHNNLGLLLEKQGYKRQAQENFERADKLAEMSGLFSQIQAKESVEIVASTESMETEQSPSLLDFIRSTFTTKAGFSQYLNFIRNGFKI